MLSGPCEKLEKLHTMDMLNFVLSRRNACETEKSRRLFSVKLNGYSVLYENHEKKKIPPILFQNDIKQPGSVNIDLVLENHSNNDKYFLEIISI